MERKPGIADVKNGVTGRVRFGLSVTELGNFCSREHPLREVISSHFSKILGYGFQDMLFRTWDLNFGAWEILGYGFQDMVFRTWDLNFGAWIFTLVVSKTET
jgi:hypothetical protein